MITVDLDRKVTKKKNQDNPSRLGKYLMYGDSYDVSNEIHRVKYKGVFNFGDALDGGDDPCDLSQAGEIMRLFNHDFNVTASKRSKDIQRTRHFEISLNAGEHLDGEQWNYMVKSYLKALGLEDHYAFYAVHKDTDNEHCHLVFSTINPITKKINYLPFSLRKLKELDSRFEKVFKLKVDNHGLKDDDLKNTRGEVNSQNIESFTGQQSLFSYIKEFKPLLDLASSWQEFHKICAEHNVNVVKMGRGLVFETPDPKDLHNTLYVKASTFNKNGEERLTLQALEKKFGKFEKAEDFSSSMGTVSTYESKPVNFLINADLDHDDELQGNLDELYNLFVKEQKLGSQEKKEIQAEIDGLRKIYYRNKRLLKNTYEKAVENLKIKYGYDPHFFNDLKDKFTRIFEKKLRENFETFNKIYLNLRKILKSFQNSRNFLSYLKSNFSLQSFSVNKRALLLTRKQSKSQKSTNYAELLRKTTDLDYSGGAADIYMSMYKVSNKGQTMYYSKNKAYSDFIKDDGNKLLINDYPNTRTVNDFLNLCSNLKEPDSVIKIFGTEQFQYDCLEFGLKKNLDLEFADNVLNANYKERKNERNRRNRRAGKSGQERRTGNTRETWGRSGKRTPRRNRRNGLSGARVFGRGLSQIRVLGAESDELGAIGASIAPISGADRGSGTFRTGRGDSPKSEERQNDTASASDTLGNQFSDTESPKTTEKREDAARSEKDRLRDMSELSVADHSQKNTVLLSDDERNRVGEQQERELLPGMRWPLHDSGRERVEEEHQKEQEIEKEYQENVYLAEHDELDAYINERNIKHQSGFRDVLKHNLFKAGQKGEFIFRGLRELDKLNFALLEQNGEIYLKEVQGYALSRLKSTKRGAVITINDQGTITNRNSSKYKKM